LAHFNLAEAFAVFPLTRRHGSPPIPAQSHQGPLSPKPPNTFRAGIIFEKFLAFSRVLMNRVHRHGEFELSTAIHSQSLVLFLAVINLVQNPNRLFIGLFLFRVYRINACAQSRRPPNFQIVYQTRRDGGAYPRHSPSA